ncbi:hypothetical protein SXCC_00342 [Gluconacetobacter sp. SXCC-1]|nr:hypothetical protein SXCC_00342 [Gluconacetobacter sp. SXCC-1]
MGCGHGIRYRQAGRVEHPCLGPQHLQDAFCLKHQQPAEGSGA